MPDTPETSNNLKIVAFSLPGRMVSEHPNAMVMTRKVISYLALFDNGKVGQYSPDGILTNTYAAKDFSNIGPFNMASGGIVKFTKNGVEDGFGMDVTATTGWTVPAALAGPNPVEPSGAFFEMVKQAKVTASTDSALPQSIPVPDFGSDLRKNGTRLLIAGIVVIVFTLILLLTGNFIWFLGFIGLALVVAGLGIRYRGSK
jgi:hypothetical protein